MSTKAFIIDHPRYGMRSEFATLQQAQDDIRDSGPEFAQTELTDDGEKITDERGEVIGHVQRTDADLTTAEYIKELRKCFEDPDWHQKLQAASGDTDEQNKCGGCGAHEGACHEFGCDMERCPFCGQQLIGCDCVYKILKIDASKGTWTYENGLTARTRKKWIKRLETKGRVPHILYPLICGRCGKLWPELFMVSDKEWKKYIPIRQRRKMLCRKCYDQIKRLIDSGGCST